MNEAKDRKTVKVELFDCTLNHGGNDKHQIPKVAVTGREMLLIKAMHGEDSIPEGSVKPHIDAKTKEPAFRDIDSKIELYELARKYANTMDPMSGKKVVERVFQTALVGFEKWLEETLELENMEREEAHQRRQDEAARRRQQDAARAAAAA